MSTSTRAIPINIHALTAPGIKAAEKAKADALSTPKRGRPSKQKLSDILTEQTVASAFRTSAPKKPVTLEQKEFISRGMKFDPKVLSPKALTTEEKEAQWYAQTIYKYYQRFPDRLGKQPKLDVTGAGVLGNLRVHLSMLQSQLNSTYAGDLGKFVVENGCWVFEAGWALFNMQFPWHPLANKSLNNLTSKVMDNYHLIEPEMAEIEILYGWIFEQGPFTRLAFKLGSIVKETMDENDKEADRRSAPVTLDAKYADL